jgi:sugar phosphate isomerase/epimerase
MRIGICTDLTHLGTAKEAGYAYAELGAANLVPECHDSVFEPIRKELLGSPLPVEAFNCFLPAHIKVTGPKVDTQALKIYMDKALRRASEVGASVMVFGSGAARFSPEGWPVEKAWQQFDEASLLAAEIGQRYGIVIALEPLIQPMCNFFNRIDQGAAMVDRINHANLRLLTDLFHISQEEPFENIVKGKSRFVHAHVPTPAIPATGEGVNYDFKGFFLALKKAGYEDRTSVEDNPGLMPGKLTDLLDVYRAVYLYVVSCLPRDESKTDHPSL